MSILINTILYWCQWVYGTGFQREWIWLTLHSEMTADSWCNCSFVTDPLLMLCHLTNPTSHHIPERSLITATVSHYVASFARQHPDDDISFICTVLAIVHTASPAMRNQPHGCQPVRAKKHLHLKVPTPSLNSSATFYIFLHVSLGNEPITIFLYMAFNCTWCLTHWRRAANNDISYAYIPKCNIFWWNKPFIHDDVSYELISGGFMTCTDQPNSLGLF